MRTVAPVARTAKMRLAGIGLLGLWLLALGGCGDNPAEQQDAAVQQDGGQVDTLVEPDTTSCHNFAALVPDGGVLLPTPTGPYAVSRGVRRTLVDNSRNLADVFDGGVGPRALSVEAWYPAEPCGSGEPAAYVDDVEGQYLEQAAPFGGGEWHKLIRSHTLVGATFATLDGGRPLVLFSPGFGGIPRLYTSLIEELVSHGYVVAAISHTLWDMVTVFADGSAVPGILDFNAQTSAARRAQLNYWVTDARFVLDQLVQLASQDPAGEINGRIDLTKVGMAGHSFGGATAVAVAAMDPRVAAGLNLDGAIFNYADLASFATPILLFSGDHARDPTWNFVLANATGAAYIPKMLGAAHENFSDLGLILVGFGGSVPSSTWTLGAIDPTRAITIADAFLVAFFDEYLGGRPSTLLDGPSSDYPEVQLYKQP